MKYEGETITGTAHLDDSEFIDCTFDGCTLVYSGGKAPSITGCRFKSFKFEFREHAANTVAFMKLMASPKSGLQRVIRDTFPALTAH